MATNCIYKYQGENYSKQELEDLLATNANNTKYVSYKNYTVNDENIMQEIFGAKGKTAEEFVNVSNNNVLEKLKKINPSITFEFNENNNFHYNPVTNKISMSLSEIYERANDWDKDIHDVLNFFIQHEMGHASTTPGLQMGDNEQYMQKILDRVLELHNKNPFLDKARGGWTTENGLPYALNSVYEFSAEAFSNPYFAKYLQAISNGNDTFLDKIINFFRNLLNLPLKNNQYDDVMNLFNSEEFKDASYEEVFKDESTMRLIEPQFAAAYWMNSYNILTNKTGEVDDEIVKIFNQIPSAISKLKNKLKDNTIDAQHAKNISTLINKFYETDDNKERVGAGMRMLDIAFRTADNIEKNMIALEKMPVGDRLLMLNTYMHQANSIDFLLPLVQDIQLWLGKPELKTTDTAIFSRQLSAIVSIRERVERKYTVLARPTLIKAVAAELGELPAAKIIFDEIKAFQDRLDKATDKNEIKRLTDRIAEKGKQLDLLPIEPTLEKAMAGKLEDASITDLNFHALALNGHPLIQGLHSMIRRKDQALTARTLKQKNDVDTIINTFKQESGVDKFRKIADVTAPIRDLTKLVKSVSENDNGDLVYEYVTTDSLLSSYDTEYKTKWDELNKALEYYWDKRNDPNITDKEKYTNLIEVKKQEIKDFVATHSEREWKDAYYVPEQIIDENIDTGKTKSDGTPIYTTLRKERGELFEKIADAKTAVESSFSQAERDEANINLDDANREFQELSSLYDESGKEKTGVDLLLAQQAIKYTEARKSIGKREMTDNDKALFQRDKDFIQETYDMKDRSYNDTQELHTVQLNNGKLSQEEYDKKIKNLNDLKAANEIERKQALNRIQTSKLSDDYFTTLDDLYGKLELTVSQILEIPKLAESFEKKDKTIFKTGYAQIRQIVKAFRDSEGIVNGIAVQKSKPEAIKIIKEIQQTLSKLSEATESLVGLSKNDKIRLKDLQQYAESGNIMSDEDRTELSSLTKEKLIKEALALKYKPLLDEYFFGIKELAAMSESEPSDYYYKELDIQLNKQIALSEKEIRKDIPLYLKNNNITVENGKYYTSAPSQTEANTIIKTQAAGSETEMISKLALIKAQTDLGNSEWWNDNHFDQYIYSKEANGYITTQTPIYIWIKQTPTDDRFVLKDTPSLTYTTFIPDESLRNPNFKLISYNLSTPKKSSQYYKNDRYSTLDKPHMRVLEALREKKYQTEEDTGMKNEQKTYDILPSIPITHNEHKINITTSLLNGDTIKNLKSATLSPSENEDVQFGQHGSLKKNNLVPYRYNHILDTHQQSKNVFAMVLMYDNANMNAANMKELEPIFEAAQLATKDLTTLKTRLVQGVFKLKRMVGFGKNTNQKTVVEEKSGNSVLNKTIVHMMDTFVHGESRTEAIIHTPFGEADAHKIVGDIKGGAARAIFAGKIFSPIKNTIAGKLNALINADIGKNFASTANYRNGTIKAAKYIPNLLQDYKKLGNKSFIGQAMDYFQVLHGGIQNEFAKDIQWSALSETFHYLAIAKHISELELQLASFLAISEANKIKLPNGDEVDFHDAFTIKNGEFIPKDGTNISKDDIKHFIDKVAIVNRYINGAFRQDEKSKIEKTPLGSMFYFLNGFVMPGIKNRYGKEFYSVEAEMVMKGYYKEAYKFAKDFFKYGKDLNLTWNTLNEDEKHRVTRFVKEAIGAISLAVLCVMMGSGDPKKKLKENSGEYNYLLALTMAVASEVQTFIPFPGLGGDEIIRKIKSPFAAVSQIINQYKLFTDFLAYSNPFDSNSGRYLRGTGNKDGLHDAGDAKFIADAAKLLGWNFSEFSPIDKVQNIKQLQTIRP